MANLIGTISSRLRLGDNHTALSFDDFEDLDRPPQSGDSVLLTDSESGKTGWGKVVAVDPGDDLITIEVDWGQFIKSESK
jgi:hypothetical protein